jgi:alanine racemase
VTSTLGITHPRPVDLLPPTLQTIPEAVTANIAIARARTRSRIMAVVKADEYGHGAITIAQTAVAAGAEWLGTTDTAEAISLRAAGLTVPILTWLNPSGVDAEAAAIGRIDIAVGSLEELEALLKQTSSTAVGSTCTWIPAWPLGGECRALDVLADDEWRIVLEIGLMHLCSAAARHPHGRAHTALAT